MIEVSADFETRSDVDLRIHGAGPYFASSHFKPLLLCYTIDGAPIRTWTCADRRCPDDLRAAIESDATISGYNVSFERQCFAWLADHWGWPRIALDRYRCTMATASALGLPRSLEKLGAALNLAVTKDKIGKSLIDFFSKPQRNGRFNEPADHPEKFLAFAAYCRTDVAAEMEAARRMIPLSNDEQAVYTLDQTINMRGIRIDRRSAVAALNLVERAKVQLDAEMREITRGAVPSCTQVAKLTAWAGARGVRLDGVAKDDILDALDLIDLPDDVRRALTIRQEAGKSSTSKLKAFLNRADVDDRVRGSFVYHGAAPGRWSNVGVNFANLPRPRALFEDSALDPAALFTAFRTEDPDYIRALYGPQLGRPLHLVADALRGFIMAAPGHDLIAVDYSGIQGAIGAWLSDEKWKLQAMREIIADPSLPDLYRRAAAYIMNSTTEIITKKHFLRQAVGKTSELALLFQGGVSALVSMAANYGLKKQAIHDLYPHVWTAADEEARERAVKRYERCLKGRDKRKTDVLSREGWLACSLIVAGWRKTNAGAVEAWGALEDAMREALRHPGVVQPVSRVAYIVSNGYLFCRLPSRRCIAYAAPKLRDQVWAKLMLPDLSWTDAEVCDREEAEKLESVGRARIEGKTSPKVTALGVNSATQKLERYAVYGGLAMENCCLAIERDLLVCGMRNCEAAGYPIVMHNYDEAVTEVPHGAGSVEEMERLMLQFPPGLYDGLPLTSHGWRTKRYHK
jgi:DNA polymerase bacteriophage-type